MSAHPVRSGISYATPIQSLPLRYQRATRKLVARDNRLTRRQKALLYALIDRVDGRLVARASHAALAQDVGSSVDTIERAQRELVAKQLLQVTRRRRYGHQGPSEYRLPLRFMDLGPNRLPIVAWETDKLASLPEPVAPVPRPDRTVPDPQHAVH
jgi:hypothetical protein